MIMLVATALLSFQVPAGPVTESLSTLFWQCNRACSKVLYLREPPWRPRITTHAVSCRKCSLQQALAQMFEGTAIAARLRTAQCVGMPPAGYVIDFAVKPTTTTTLRIAPRVDSPRSCQCAQSEDALPLGPWCRDREGLHFMPKVCSR